MNYITASVYGTKKLYHYQSSNPRSLQRLILENSIYLSAPDTFNDPWDCRPCYDTNLIEDPANFERHVQFFNVASRKNFPEIPKSEHDRREGILRSNPDFMRKLINEATDGIFSEIAKQYRLYCLTTNPSDILMWAHYADHHKGICIEFDCENAVFSGALKVNYVQDYPLTDLSDDSLSKALIALLTKSDSWKYEREYRLIAQESGFSRGSDTLITHKGLLKIPAQAVTSIILGCASSEETKTDILSLLKLRPDIVLKKAVPSRSKYALDISGAD